MPVDATSQTALIVLAIAASVQAVVMVAAVVGSAIAWQRAQVEFDRRYRELSARLDEAIQPLRQAADAVQHASNRASDAIGRAGQVATTATALLAGPKTLVTYGVASLASLALARWRRKPVTPAGRIER